MEVKKLQNTSQKETAAQELFQVSFRGRSISNIWASVMLTFILVLSLLNLNLGTPIVVFSFILTAITVFFWLEVYKDKLFILEVSAEKLRWGIETQEKYELLIVDIKSISFINSDAIPMSFEVVSHEGMIYKIEHQNLSLVSKSFVQFVEMNTELRVKSQLSLLIY